MTITIDEEKAKKRKKRYGKKNEKDSSNTIRESEGKISIKR